MRPAFIGKWHMGLDDNARPGIDHWVSVKGQGSYNDPEFNVNGKREKIPGYFTDILNRFALDFLKQNHNKPYLLYISHKAVHPDLVQYADGSVSDPSAGKVHSSGASSAALRWSIDSASRELWQNSQKANLHYSDR